MRASFWKICSVFQFDKYGKKGSLSFLTKIIFSPIIVQTLILYIRGDRGYVLKFLYIFSFLSYYDNVNYTEDLNYSNGLYIDVSCELKNI